MGERGGSQAKGLAGALVDRMIRRSVRKSFRNVYWIPPEGQVADRTIFVANHHGWHDGYVMYLASSALGLRTLLWIEEFEAFPLFAKLGGMPFPVGDAAGRAKTIRRTLRLMSEEGRCLLIFAEGELHPPPTLLPFGRALEFVAGRSPQSPVVPVAIRYELSLHERPECFIAFGQPLHGEERTAERCRLATGHMLDVLAAKMRLEREAIQVLAPGTPDVNERWDMRRIPGR
jgi:1-acyl-sn-glycerol-3-phosphate acyltransferase